MTNRIRRGLFILWKAVFILREAGSFRRGLSILIHDPWSIKFAPLTDWEDQ